MGGKHHSTHLSISKMKNKLHKAFRSTIVHYWLCVWTYDTFFYPIQTRSSFLAFLEYAVQSASTIVGFRRYTDSMEILKKRSHTMHSTQRTGTEMQKMEKIILQKLGEINDGEEKGGENGGMWLLNGIFANMIAHDASACRMCWLKAPARGLLCVQSIVYHHYLHRTCSK